jgi:hypothetical protein
MKLNIETLPDPLTGSGDNSSNHQSDSHESPQHESPQNTSSL